MKKMVNSGRVNVRDRPAVPRNVSNAIKKLTNVTMVVDALKNYGKECGRNVPRWISLSRLQPIETQRNR